MTRVEARLAELGHTLPPPPEPIGNYLSASRSGNIMWMAGVGSRRAGGSLISGKLGADLSVEQGDEALVFEKVTEPYRPEVDVEEAVVNLFETDMVACE